MYIWHLEVLTLHAKTCGSRYIVFKQCCCCDEWLQTRTFHWSMMQGKTIYLPACRRYRIDIFILILICNSVVSGYFVILRTPLCSLRMWLFCCPVKLQLRFPDVSVVSVLIHSCFILILILEPFTNKETQRQDLSCTFCNPQYLLKSLLFLRGWLMPTCLMFKRVCRLCARPSLSW